MKNRRVLTDSEETQETLVQEDLRLIDLTIETLKVTEVGYRQELQMLTTWPGTLTDLLNQK